MALRSMTDTLKDFVAEALDHHSDDGEKVSWDIGSGMGPNNQLFHFLTLVMPSPVLGDVLMAGGIIGGAHNIDSDKIDTMVFQALEQLRQARSEKLSSDVSAIEAQATSSGGLILP